MKKDIRIIYGLITKNEQKFKNLMTWESCGMSHIMC